ncbi:S1C family serine protease [Methyloversatilis discipulorum]|uniref:S1C family serine protease n=1 Tax=Methyloversatilis discipulorum TaxID=1119528 RepID=UPI0012F80209|nr:serine protease [Methyloversatilis discipulorum]
MSKRPQQIRSYRDFFVAVVFVLVVRPGVVEATPTRAFEAVAPALLSLRTHAPGNDKALSQGSAFLVDADGRAVTAFHVVKDTVEQPAERLLRYRTMDGEEGTASVLAVDLINDVAIIATDLKGRSHLRLPEGDVRLPRPGDTLYAFGDPLGLGMYMTAGSYGGPSAGSGRGRLRYGGALNPGMSGGPTVSADGALVGVNVSKVLFSEAIGFLSGIEGVNRIYREALAAPAGAGQTDLRAVVAHRVKDHLDAFSAQITPPWKPVQLGTYHFHVPSSDNWICSARAKDIKPDSRYDRRGIGCRFVAGIEELDGRALTRVGISATYLAAIRLHPMHLASIVRTEVREARGWYDTRKVVGQRCEDRTLKGAESAFPLRLIWCASPMRNTTDRYNFTITAVTQDDDDKALIVAFDVEGVSWQHGMTMTERLIKGMNKAETHAVARSH